MDSINYVCSFVQMVMLGVRVCLCVPFTERKNIKLGVEEGLSGRIWKRRKNIIQICMGNI